MKLIHSQSFSFDVKTCKSIKRDIILSWQAQKGIKN